MKLLRTAYVQPLCSPTASLQSLNAHSSRFSITRNLSTMSHPSTNTKLSRPLPAGTWDSHMHIVEPERFPLSTSAQYTPHAHTLEQGREFYSPFGIKNMVIVQPSIYGNDNSCTLQALKELTPKHGRAVVQLDPNTITDREMREWHDLGVRGVRVNLVSVGRDVTATELRKELESYAKVIKPYDWVLELFVPMKLIRDLEDVVPTLGVKVCIDHFGWPTLPKPFDPSKAIRPYELPGFESVVKLAQRDTWIKISAPYRLTQDEEMRDLDVIGRELIKECSDRVVFATDWPHTRFENVDSVPFIEKCFEWCGAGTGLEEKLFRTNAEELWDVR